MQSDSEARLKSDARFQVRSSQGFMALSLVLVATMMPVFVQAVAERGLIAVLGGRGLSGRARGYRGAQRSSLRVK